MTAGKRVMGLDIGEARTGVALSDLLQLTAQPFCTIEKKGRAAAAEIVRLAAEQQVETIVIGLPKTMAGELGPQAQKTTAFADTLKALLTKEGMEIAVHFWDERLSTAQAEGIIAGSKLKNRERSAALDRIAAAIILDSFLANKAFCG